MAKGPGLAMYAASFAVVGFIGGALVGPHPARRKSSALNELLVNLSRSGRLKRTPYRKKPSRSAWIRLLPRARPRRRVSPAPGLLGRQAAPPNPAVTALGLAHRAVSKRRHDRRRSCEKRITRPAGSRTQRMGCGALRI